MLRLRSLRSRVLLWVSVALVGIFAATIIGLDLTFRRTTDRALRELLDVQLFGLVATAQPDPESGLVLSDDLTDPRFSVPGSGLFGALWDDAGRLVWRSWSSLDQELNFGSLPPPGGRRAVRLTPADMPALEAALLGVTWEFEDGRVRNYTFGVAQSLLPYQDQQRAFRWNLVGWFASMTAVMLIVVGMLLGWTLRPLRRLEREVRAVEQGSRERLGAGYPSELTGLARNLDLLIETERRRQSRYRNTLDDLAHSLKTPMAVIRSQLTELPLAAASQRPLTEQLDRVDERVSYHLQRARASGALGLGLAPVSVAAIARDLKDSLDKVYRDKAVTCELELSDVAAFRGDRGDLLEILGNLMDNAYKFAQGRVRLTAQRSGMLVLTVEDDGPGLRNHDARDVTQRGARIDESVPGQGIGLAVVRDIVELYQGVLELETSAWGGLCARVTLP
jgi:two-component system sensor histidine kinase PhoQ